MSTILKALGREVGPGRRILFALCALFAPGTLIASVAKAFLRIVEDLDENELRRLVEELKDV
jgi:hypothetical protein